LQRSRRGWKASRPRRVATDRPAAPARQRIDKWLWFARLAKTRTLAQRLAVSGRVRINREKCAAASDLVKAGDVLTIALERGVRVLRIRAPGTRRGPPAEARVLFEDLSPPAEPPMPAAPDGVRPAGSGRPTKRDRRRLDAVKDGTDEDFSRDGD
jgi:ribosome-associated heat shock protein Hsp15